MLLAPIIVGCMLAGCTIEGAADGLPSGSGGGGGGDETNPCPSGMVYLPQNRVHLGEWDVGLLETYAGTVIPDEFYSTDPFCIATFPMPGAEGAAWPTDGLSLDQLPDVEAALDTYGRRLCTVPELLLASAGEDNWRHPYDPEERSSTVCEPDDFNPSPLGAYQACESPMGVRDFEVRSTWALLDELTLASLDEVWGGTIPGDAVYAVWGGTSRADTYYAPSNFGVHFHGAGEDPYTDDALRVCADPGGSTQDQDAAWSASMQDFIDAGSFAAWLALH